MLKKIVREMNLNRVVVASCTPRTHEPLFQETIRDAGLNKYLFDLADIREQCSWCHMGQKEEATKKAIQIVKMAIAKTRLLEPLITDTVGVTPAAMVIGGGIAGITAALSLADQGFHVSLIEREKEMGGLLKNLYRTLEGEDVRNLLKARTEHVLAHERIRVYTDVEVKKTEGFVGNFETTLTNGKVIRHGVIILAKGGAGNERTADLY